MRSPLRPSIASLVTIVGLASLLSGCESDPASTAAGDGLEPVERLALEVPESNAKAEPTRTRTEAAAEAARANAEQLRAQAEADVDAWLDREPPTAERSNQDQAARTARRLERLTAPREPAPDAAPATTAPPAIDEPVLARDPAPPVTVTAPPPAPSAVATQLAALRRVLAGHAPSGADDGAFLRTTAHALLDATSPLPPALAALSSDERHRVESFRPFFTQLAAAVGGDRTVASDLLDAGLNALAPVSADPDPAPEAQLRLPRAALCWRVEDFGAFNAFAPYAWLAGRPTQVIVYLELDDFASETDADGAFVTTISQKLDIYADADGALVWTQDWQRAVDVTKQRRRDFFTTQLVELPAALSVGDYHLKIRARDETNGAEAETSLAFRMVADPKLAGRRE